MPLKQTLAQFLPPIVVHAVRRFRASSSIPSLPEWEWIADGWTAKSRVEIKGWNVPDVAAAYVAKWPAFLQSLEGTRPFGIPVDGLNSGFDLAFHNTVMSFAHALATASRGKNRISMLDWGGGLGHYSLIGRALFPDLSLDYACKDLPALTEQGKRLLPQVLFYTDDACFARSYDFVMASTSLHYHEDWRNVADKLAGVAKGFVFISGLPVVTRAASFVFVQRAYAYGYNTEYLAWCFNRDEFLDRMRSFGVHLEREYVLGYRPYIHNAPEQCDYRGYLFRGRNYQ